MPVAGWMWCMAIGNLLANGPEGGRPELVSLSTLVFVCSYPCAAATVILALRGRSGPPGIGALLDAIVGTLAVAALLMAFVLPPALAATRHDPVGLMLVLVFPVLDLAMAALGLSVLAMSTARSEQLSGWLGLGMVTFAVADWQLAVGMARGTWEGGHPIDAAWVISSAAVGLGAVSRRLPAARADDPRRPTGFAVTIGAAAVALDVMVAGTETTMPRAGVLLAAACVLAALLRMLVAHGQMRSLAQVSQWARTDELTGLSNRRVLNEALARLQRSGARDPALLLADLDRFKQVNDHFGHEVGDRVLAEVAEQFRRVVPAGSLLARLGGDEFAVLVLDVLLLGGPEEVNRHRELLAQNQGRAVFDGGNHNSYGRFAGLIEQCRVVVTSDSLAGHVAAAVIARATACPSGPSSTNA